MKKNLIKLSNEVINEKVVAYQQQPSDTLYMDIHEAVFPMAETVAYGYYHKSKGLNVTKDEYVQCARLAIFKAMDVYDAEKGSNFTSLVKQLVSWTINDEIFKKAKTKVNEFHNNALSLDKPLNSNEGTFLDAIEYQIATDIDEVFNSISADHDNYDNPQSILINLTKEFAQESSVDDATIIKTWVGLVLSNSENTDTSAFSRVVNSALKEVFPNTAPASLRKKKERAEDRFNKFAQLKGFSAFKLSHF